MLLQVILILSLVLIGLGLFSYLISKTKFYRNIKPVSQPEEESEECCGQHAVCEKLSLNAKTQIEYFDDEELDAYANIQPDEYTDEQIEEFRDVLLTLKKNEVLPWLKSLERRQVLLPDCVKEEALIITSEI